MRLFIVAASPPLSHSLGRVAVAQRVLLPPHCLVLLPRALQVRREGVALVSLHPDAAGARAAPPLHVLRGMALQYLHSVTAEVLPAGCVDWPQVRLQHVWGGQRRNEARRSCSLQAMHTCVQQV